MFLLTPFVTILRVEEASFTVLHAPLWPVPQGSHDMRLDISPPLETPVTFAGLPGMILEPAADGQSVFLTRDGRDLCVHPAQRAAFLRSHDEGRFAFLLVSETAAANLRDIVSHRWRDGGGGDAPVCTPMPAEPFLLEFGRFSIDLQNAMPIRCGEAGDAYELGQGPSTHMIHRAGRGRPEILLRRRPQFRQPPIVATIQALHDTPDSQLLVAAESEMLALPLTVCAADHAWLHDKPYAHFHQITGRVRCQPAVVRESDKFVMLARHTEGHVFDARSFSTEFGYTDHLGTNAPRHLPMPPGMRCEGDRLFVDRATLDAAPRLAGPLIVFTTPNLPNYAHWLIDAILPLTVLMAHAPAHAKIILPATLRGFGGNPIRICDHHDILRAFGLSDLAFVELADPYVRADDVYWLDRGFIQNMPAAWLLGLRERVMKCRPAPARDRNVYIARRGTRQVENATEVERFLLRRNFTFHTLDDLSIDDQIDLFSAADWVVAAHGAELGNLLFCQPGTKVLELSPELDFKPYFSYMCNKLSLHHGVLPCPTTDGGFNGRLVVDMNKFRALFRMLHHRL
jgi:hypothetical protein